MKLLGYTFPDGTILCARHAKGTPFLDDGNVSGQAFAIYNNYEAHSNMVCDVPQCGVILEKNCTDGCETGTYYHALFYDDRDEAQFALKWVRVEYDEDAEVTALFGYDFAVLFETEHELSDEQAQELFQITKPDAYDLNADEDDEDDDDLSELTGFPEVFTDDIRSAALAKAEEELTIEYIDRLERVAVAAFAYYAAKSPHSDSKLSQALYEALSTVNCMQ